MMARIRPGGAAGLPARAALDGPRWRWTAVTCALMAGAALAGAIGLVGGSINLGQAINWRLPLHSPVLGGAALLVIVAVPMAAAAVACWRGIARAPQITMLAGLALIGWIVAEIAFIQTFAWLQPVCAAYGALVAGLGWRAQRATDAGRRA